MEQGVTKEAYIRPVWTRVGQAAGVVIAGPFLIGAVSLWLKLAHLPAVAGNLAKALVLGAALFATGIGLGIVGAVLALSAHTAHRRTLCTALTLFGLSHVLFGLYVRYAIDATTANSQPQTLPVVIPIAVWAYSVQLALRAPKIDSPHQANAPEQDVTEEQPQPLSRP